MNTKVSSHSEQQYIYGETQTGIEVHCKCTNASNYLHTFSFFCLGELAIPACTEGITWTVSISDSKYQTINTTAGLQVIVFQIVFPCLPPAWQQHTLPKKVKTTIEEKKNNK